MQSPVYRTLLELLRARAGRQSSQVGYVFLTDNEQEEIRLSYGELDRLARSIGALLQSIGAADQRVLLLYPPGLDYIAAFFGCVYAGAIAVPVFPPHPRRPMPRLQAITAEASATVALTTRQIYAGIEQRITHHPQIAALRWIATDALPDSLQESWQEPHIDANTITFLQYTSGSVGAPKGVMLTHRNLLQNSQRIYDHFGHSGESIGVSWLPSYHDMGLIGGILQPLYGGFPVTLLSPAAFLQQPLRWLQAITHYRATTSGGPNFAYELCIRTITAEKRATLDLRSWEVAFNGAETVRPETLGRFAATFAECGFRRQAFYPCYGLAEATLFVAGTKKLAGPVVRSFDTTALEQNQAIAVETEQQTARQLVGYSIDADRQELLVVHPQRLTECAQGEVGEIWIASESVAQGYWKREDDTARSFGATVANRPGVCFLRTGDLGFIYKNGLFVTGRLKDVIVIRGRNHYPQDIELTAELAHPALRAGCGAAFAVEVEGVEQLVIAYEIERQYRYMDTQEIIDAVRQAVTEQHEIQTYAILLIKPGGIPKTSSGKVQHRACKEQFLAGTLPVIAQSILNEATHVEEEAPLDRQALAQMTPGEGERLLLDYLRKQAARVLHISAHTLDPEQPLSAFGLDSLMALELRDIIESNLEVELSFVSFLQGESLNLLVRRLLQRPQAQKISAAPSSRSDVQEFQGMLPLTHGQRALWLLDQLEPGNSTYTIAHAVTIRGALDRVALHKALQMLVERHQALRTSFTLHNHELVQVVHAWGEIPFQMTDAADWSKERLQQVLADCAAQPFELDQYPLFRVYLFQRSSYEHVLLLTAHHAVVDLWSISVLVNELDHCYRAARGKTALPLPAVICQYSDYVRWQTTMLNEQAGEQQWTYWQQRLAGSLPMLSLPHDYLRPPVKTHRGASQSVTLGIELTRQLKALAQQEGVTLFSLLLAAFNILLYGYSQQHDLLVGVPATGRSQASSRGMVGYCVNSVVIRTELSGDLSFQALLQQVHRHMLDALAHQDYPFPLLVERLQPERDSGSTPLFQVMFALQKAPRGQLSAFVINDPEAKINLDDLEIRPLPPVQQTAKFDITVEVVETEQALRARFEYATDLFEAATIEQMIAHYQRLLTGIITHPEQLCTEPPLLSKEERQRILFEWNATERSYLVESLVHELVHYQAQRTPDAFAVVGANARLLYQELEQKANRLAHYLRSLGVGPDVPVVVYKERTPALIVAQLAILKAGGAYVPVDPTTPAERTAFIIEDTQASLVLVDQPLGEKLPPLAARLLCHETEWAVIAEQPATPPLSDVRLANLAYVIYTSGSTGNPKGTELTHLSLLNLLFWHLDAFKVSARDRAAQLVGLGFDVAVWDIWSYLICGACIYLPPDEETRVAPQKLLAWLLEQEITICFVATPLAELLIELEWPQQCALRFLLTGGDALRRYPSPSLPCTLVNLYGPTENTVVSTMHIVEPSQGENALPPPIGTPISNVQTYVLDSRLNPVPIGVTGELYLAGKNLARGYLRRPDLTTERFLPNPFSSEPGARMYKTGDLVYYRRDGAIAFLGRSDHQVKILGRRIELGEIEVVLKRHPALMDAVVLAVEDALQHKRLVAYIVGNDGDVPTSVDLRDYLRERLPEYMIPAIFISLEALPLTMNGKVDRHALSILASAPAEQEKALPRTDTEHLLAMIWAEVLGLQQQDIGIYDNFFELGGHSLLATQVQTRIQSALQLEISLQVIFTHITIADLATWIDSAQQIVSTNTTTESTIERANRTRSLPLSFAQQRIWLLDQLLPGNTAYNISGAVHIHGKLNIAALGWSLNEVVQRHESLRTTFIAQDGQPVQYIAPALTLALPVHSLREEDAQTREKLVQQYMLAAAREPFDLARGLLLRTQLLQLTEEENVLLVTMHHIISDGWSLGLLVREISTLYTAFMQGQQTSPLPPLPLQYADYASWQHRWLEGEECKRQLEYWKQKLDGPLPRLELPTDAVKSGTQDFQGAQCTRLLDARSTTALHMLCQREGVTPFMVMLAAFQVLLQRLSGQEDILVGSPVSGRQQSETEQLIGCFVNTVVLRGNLAGNPGFRELLQQVRSTVLEALEHQDLPFEKLLEALQPERSLSRTPLFDVMLNYVNTPALAFALSDLDVRLLPLPEPESKFAMTLYVEPQEDTLLLRLVYRKALFSEQRIAAFLDQFVCLLDQLTITIERPVLAYSLLTPQARELLPDPTELLIEPDYDVLPHVLAHQADCIPELPAIRWHQRQWNYKELYSTAERIGKALLAQGLRKGEVVAVSGRKSFGLIASMLGVLLGGGVLLTLDHNLPSQRQQAMLRVSGAKYRLVAGQDQGRQAPGEIVVDAIDGDIACDEGDAALPVLRPDDAAYLFFTSGTTGTPRGIIGSHKGLAHFLTWQSATFAISADDRAAQLTGLSFDVVLRDIFLPLVSGAMLCLPEEEDAILRPQYLLSWLEQEQITLLHTVPTLAQSWLNETVGGRRPLPYLRLLFFAGEPLQEGLVRQWRTTFGETTTIVNLYGPTETTLAKCCYIVPRLPHTGVQPVGRPLPATQALVLNAVHQLCGIGEPGEIVIRTPFRSLGYIGGQHACFQKNPFRDDKADLLYYTGDRGRYSPEGLLEILGRIDDQIKIHGMRIEPQEIESVLTQHLAVRNAVVVAHEDTTGQVRLIAYIVPDRQQSLEITELRLFLRDRLPLVMHPFGFVQLDALPVTANGKVDRSKLPPFVVGAVESSESYVAPRTSIERDLATLWAAVLQVERVGIRDSFFDLGGHSLLAAQLVARGKDAFGVDLRLQDLFIAPTIENMGKQIEEQLLLLVSEDEIADLLE